MQLLLLFSVFISMLVLVRQLEVYTASKLAQYGKYRLRYLTAFIGTPVHELSHALLCILARHKIHEIKLLQLNGSSQLGYVYHSFNPKSLYQQCGRFFIGIAPIFGGLLTMAIVSKFIYPHYGFGQVIGANQHKLLAISSISGYLDVFAQNIGHALALFTELFNQGKLKFIVWFFSMASITSHLCPSASDMKGAASGALFLSALLAFLFFAANINLYSIALTAISLLLGILMLFFLVLIIYFILLVVLAKLIP
ncbi:hypothetical protein ACQKP8_02955 [Photobacterium alginatilyticum]|uniref:hypothetical protein n=1 Tax=Photobacterium alginatilyticum TaxID=1775171 RepID=UPI004068DDD5